MTSRQGGNGLNRHASFMDARHTYSHCLASKEPDAIVSDLHAQHSGLTHPPRTTTPRTFGIFPYPLPPLPSRLAVVRDPRGGSRHVTRAAKGQCCTPYYRCRSPNPLQEIKRLTRIFQ